jgi:hypothetical protein
MLSVPRLQSYCWQRPCSARSLPQWSPMSDSHGASAKVRRTSRDVLLVPLSFALGTLAMGIAAGTSSAQIARAALDATSASSSATINVTSTLSVSRQQLDPATIVAHLAQSATLLASVRQPAGSERQNTLADSVGLLGAQDSMPSRNAQKLRSSEAQKLSQNAHTSAGEADISRDEMAGVKAKIGWASGHIRGAATLNTLFAGVTLSKKGLS